MEVEGGGLVTSIVQDFAITILLRLALSELDKDFSSYEGMNNLTI